MESLQLIVECKDNIANTNYKYFTATKSGNPRGRLTGQRTKAKGTDFAYWLSLCVNKSALFLPTCNDADKTAKLTITYLKQFCLQIHTDTATKESKTKVLFILWRGKARKESQPISATSSYPMDPRSRSPNASPNWVRLSQTTFRKTRISTITLPKRTKPSVCWDLWFLVIHFCFLE